MPAHSTAAALKSKTLRRNWGSFPHVKRVFWVCEVTGTVGCLFHDLCGADFCEAVSVAELEATDDQDRRLDPQELWAEITRLALVVTREPKAA